MKTLHSILTLLIFLVATNSVNAQKIKVIQGDPKVLRSETSINIEFTYSPDMKVGKMTEAAYIEKRKKDMNDKAPGGGDKWAASWVTDRKSAYEPKFIRLFTETSKMSNEANARYTLIFNTIFTEPGFSAGWPVNKNALISGTASIVETSNKNNVIAVLSVENAPGRMAMGVDFATSWRIAEAYAMAGRELARYIF